MVRQAGSRQSEHCKLLVQGLRCRQVAALTCHAVRLVHHNQRQRHARRQRSEQVRVVQALGADKQHLDAPCCDVIQHLARLDARLA